MVNSIFFNIHTQCKIILKAKICAQGMNTFIDITWMFYTCDMFMQTLKHLLHRTWHLSFENNPLAKFSVDYIKQIAWTNGDPHIRVLAPHWHQQNCFDKLFLERGSKKLHPKIFDINWILPPKNFDQKEHLTPPPIFWLQKMWYPGYFYPQKMLPKDLLTPQHFWSPKGFYPKILHTSKIMNPPQKKNGVGGEIKLNIF